uniref:Uncharacterized protein n=1 Tax=Lactuca sativa TaxID=4236 RepID=A0A9R1UHG5_LACSA|nr:hypothetical protein LSAT_V11C900467770 [Lactuca sativa]
MMFHRTTSTTYSYDHIFTSEPPIQTASRTPPTTGRGVLELQSFSVSNTLKHNCVHGGSGGERMIDLIFNFIFRFLVKLRKIQIDMEGLIFSLPPLIFANVLFASRFSSRFFSDKDESALVLASWLEEEKEAGKGKIGSFWHMIFTKPEVVSCNFRQQDQLKGAKVHDSKYTTLPNCEIDGMKKIFIILAFSPKLNRKKDNFQLQQPHQKIGLNGYRCYLGKIGKKIRLSFRYILLK